MNKITQKFINIIILIVLSNCDLKAQYSNYYNINSQSNSNVNVNANINHNVSGTVFSHSTQTIKNIDYGALALANAQKEQNKIEKQKIEDEKQKKMLSEIVNDPSKAYDYGSWEGFSLKDKTKFDKKTRKQFEENTDLKSFDYSFVFPIMFFSKLDYWNWQNVSSDGIVTEIYLSLPKYNKENLKIDIEEQFEKDTIWLAGKEVSMKDENGKIKKTFIHKKDINLATVFSYKGFKTTGIWEDKYEKGITDNYVVFLNNSSSVGNGITIFVKVRYHGDKDEVSFEQLEGRRYYLRGLIEKIIATAKIQDIKLQE
jgi:hypothetical protein